MKTLVLTENPILVRLMVSLLSKTFSAQIACTDNLRITDPLWARKRKSPHTFFYTFFFFFCLYLQNVLKFFVQGLTIRARERTPTHACLTSACRLLMYSGLKCSFTVRSRSKYECWNRLSTDPLESNGSLRALLGNHKFSHADRKFGNSVTRLWILH